MALQQKRRALALVRVINMIVRALPILLILAIVVLGALNYRSLAFFLIAGAGALALIDLIGWIRHDPHMLRLKIGKTLGVLAIIGTVATAILFVTRTRPIWPGPPPPLLLVDEYEARIEQNAVGDGTFAVREIITLDQRWAEGYKAAGKPPLIRPVRIVTWTRRGLILREVTLTAATYDSSGYASNLEADGSGNNEFMFWYTKAKSTVILKGLKRGTFYGADNATSVTVNTYRETESATWTCLDPESEIRFALFPSNLGAVSRFVRPIASLFELSSWIAGVMGAFAFSLITVLRKRLGQRALDLRLRGQRHRRIGFHQDEG